MVRLELAAETTFAQEVHELYSGACCDEFLKLLPPIPSVDKCEFQELGSKSVEISQRMVFHFVPAKVLRCFLLPSRHDQEPRWLWQRLL